MSALDRNLIRRVGVAMVILWLALTCTFSILKLTTSWAWVGGLPWAEVILGPAITAGCCFLLISGGTWISARRGERG